jgi:hypothetical protein
MTIYVIPCLNRFQYSCFAIISNPNFFSFSQNVVTTLIYVQ